MNKIKFLTLLLCSSYFTFAQTNVSNGHEFIELAKIVNRYSSRHDLNFTVHLTYADSLSQTNIVDSNTVSYNISGGKMFMSNANMEALDNKMISVYVEKADSSIYIGNSQQKTILQLPFMDSVFRRAHVKNIQMMSSADGMAKLLFAFNPGSFYHGYEITYDPASDLISQIKYYVPSQAQYSLPASSLLCITLQLSAYTSTPVDPSIFNEARYYYMLNNKYYPQPAYQNYKIQSY